MSETYNLTETISPLFKQPVIMIAIFAIGYSAVFLMAIVGNVVVLITVARNPSMHSVINFFICNLSIADLLCAIFVIPITFLSTILSEWRMGEFLCRSTPYLQGMTVCASVATLTVIAFDRFLAICYPLKRFINSFRSKIIIVSIWVFSALLLLPWAIYYRLSVNRMAGNVTNCFANFSGAEKLWGAHGENYFLGVIFITCYAIPLILITAFYTGIAIKLWRRVCSNNGESGVCLMKNNGGINREKSKKVVKMLATVVILFALSWLPLYSSILAAFYLPGQVFVDRPNLALALKNFVIPLSQFLGSANSCMNPWIYCLFSKNYRNSFRAAILCQRLEYVRRITTTGGRADLEGNPRKFGDSREYTSNILTATTRYKVRKETQL